MRPIPPFLRPALLAAALLAAVPASAATSRQQPAPAQTLPLPQPAVLASTHPEPAAPAQTHRQPAAADQTLPLPHPASLAPTQPQPATLTPTQPAPTPAGQTPPHASAAQRIHRKFSIRGVEVLGKRPMKEIGVQQTRFDSAVLRGNVALSMADVLAFHSPVFVKSYGRATLSTVSFRGTSASHTQVTWNGLRLNSPMLGMTDFSMIPANLIDGASLLHGTSSVGEAGGGLGGLVKLTSAPAASDGFTMQYIQGAGSFRTFDEFLRLGWGNERWQVSTRAYCQSSPNDYEFRNRDKKENIYDDEHRIIGQYYPVERNRSGAYRDLHILQEATYRTARGDRFGLHAWYLDSDRELAMLTTDYGDDADFENRQRERTLRGVVSWEHLRSRWKLGARGGYVHTWSAYEYERDRGNGIMASMTRSRSRIDTYYGQLDGEFSAGRRWFFTANLAMHQHLVESADRNVLTQEGGQATVGYAQGRIELSGSVSARWRPVDPLGLSLVLRQEVFGTERAPLIPAFLADWVLSRRGNVTLRASVSRNYRFPTLNDLYFMPGGNPALRSEHGFSWEGGLSFALGREGAWSLSGSAAWFDQHIDDWILWLPTPKGFFSPVNVRQVHAYGIEARGDLSVALGRSWMLGLASTFSWTPSVNRGEPMSPADRSVGKQLPYVPLRSATLSGRLAFRSWELVYGWCHYSERFTMSSNDLTLSGRLPAYYMNNLSLEKRFAFPWADLSVKCAVENLFDEEYLSVLSRPMPGIHFEFFLSITPRWGRN